MAKGDPQFSDHLYEEGCHDNQSSLEGQEVLSGLIVLPDCQTFKNQIQDEKKKGKDSPNHQSRDSYKEKYYKSYRKLNTLFNNPTKFIGI
jgi:hypothetical protein